MFPASTRYTVARLTPSVVAMVLAGSPLACIRCARAAFERSRALRMTSCRLANVAELVIRTVGHVFEEALPTLPTETGSAGTGWRRQRLSLRGR